MRQMFVLACAVAALAAGCSKAETPQAAESAQETSATAERNSPAADSGGGVRYLALGDSLTQGVGAVDEQTGAFPALLAEHWRADGCDVELQNAGISGYTAGQILAEQVPQMEYGSTRRSSRSRPVATTSSTACRSTSTSVHGAEFVDYEALYAEQAERGAVGRRRYPSDPRGVRGVGREAQRGGPCAL